MPDLGALVPLAVIGALLNLDRQVFGHFMFSRPLMIGFFMGCGLDRLEAGLLLGLTAELLGLAALPLGGQITPNLGLAVGSVLSAWAESRFGISSETGDQVGLLLAFMAVMLWARVFCLIEILSRRPAFAAQALALRRLSAGRPPRLMLLNLSGLGLTLALSWLGFFLAAALTLAAFNFLAGLMPAGFPGGPAALFPAFPLLGFLALAVSLPGNKINFYAGGLLAGLLILSLT